MARYTNAELDIPYVAHYQRAPRYQSLVIGKDEIGSNIHCPDFQAYLDALTCPNYCSDDVVACFLAGWPVDPPTPPSGSWTRKKTRNVRRMKMKSTSHFPAPTPPCAPPRRVIPATFPVRPVKSQTG